MRVLTAGGEVDYDERGTLRVYRPNDHFRLNGAMFTRWAAARQGTADRAANDLAAYIVVHSASRPLQCQCKSSLEYTQCLCPCTTSAVCGRALNLNALICNALTLCFVPGAPCRSLGDFHFKTPVPLLTSEPHVTQHQLTPADRLVLLTSDGVTDVLPDDDVIELAFRAVEKVGRGCAWEK